MKRRLAWLLVVALMVMAFGATGCAPKEEAAPAETTDAPAEEMAEEVIKIGVFQPMTGANAAGGAMEVEGIELATNFIQKLWVKKFNL